MDFSICNSWLKWRIRISVVVYVFFLLSDISGDCAIRVRKFSHHHGNNNDNLTSAQRCHQSRREPRAASHHYRNAFETPAYATHIIQRQGAAIGILYRLSNISASIATRFACLSAFPFKLAICLSARLCVCAHTSFALRSVTGTVTSVYPRE